MAAAQPGFSERGLPAAVAQYVRSFPSQAKTVDEIIRPVREGDALLIFDTQIGAGEVYTRTITVREYRGEAKDAVGIPSNPSEGDTVTVVTTYNSGGITWRTTTTYTWMKDPVTGTYTWVVTKTETTFVKYTNQIK